MDMHVLHGRRKSLTPSSARLLPVSCSELGATTGGAGGANAPAAADAEWQQLHLSPFDAVEQPGAEPLALKARSWVYMVFPAVRAALGVVVITI